ncbi:DUF6492 family protein [Gorillibacterium massiliense]|uniref:DUF6492 family protein n=1 Tax=Gorillibacterium massiliense TaxID=1280390 RepID=UPI0004BAFAC9|nr:DUF6492 family protein [Gorillibacterium massiliense]
MSISQEKIDVLIPAIEKDLVVLPYVIKGIRKNVRHPIGSIYIVSPESAKIRELCEKKDCQFVDEQTVLPLTKKDIRYSSPRFERSGWMLQQLLKYAGDQVCKENAFLTMDAGTVLIRPHVFKDDGKTVYYYREWSQPEYFRMHRRLLGRKKHAPVSFVAHYMLFEKDKLARLKKKIEARHGAPWYQAILRNTDKTKLYGFSEFETYGNFVYSKYPETLVLVPTRNRHLKTSIQSLSAARKKRLAARYRSLSFHARKSYFRKKRPDAQ